MSEDREEKGLCIVCKQELTTIHTESGSGISVFVCKKCLDTTKENFIWICLHCGSVYTRPKELVLKRITDPQIRDAYHFCEDLQMVQGLDHCIECAPEEIFNTAHMDKKQEGGGHC